MELIGTIGEQTLDFGRGQAARLWVGGVEPEIVGEDQAARLHDPQHVGADTLTEFGIKDRGNGCGLQHQVEGMGRERQGLSIRMGQSAGRQNMMGLRQAVEEQVHAIQVLRQSPEPQVFGQHTPAAAAHLQDGKTSQAGQTVLFQGLQNGALAALDGKQVGRIEPGIQVAACKTALAVCIFSPQAGNIIQRVPLTTQERRPYCHPSGSRI